MIEFKYPRQLLLDLNLGYTQTFDNFITGSNQELCDMLQSLHPFNYGYENSIYCWSDNGNGKSHLLRAYCAYWQEQGISVNYISCGNMALDEVGIIPNQFSVMVFDDIQTVVGNREREDGLLSMLIQCYERDIPLLCSSNSPPAEFGCILNDIATRLASFYVFKVESLNHTDLKKFIGMEANRCGLALSSKLIEKIYSSHKPLDMKLITDMMKKLALRKEQNGLLSMADINTISGMMHH